MDELYCMTCGWSGSEEEAVWCDAPDYEDPKFDEDGLPLDSDCFECPECGGMCARSD